MITSFARSLLVSEARVVVSEFVGVFRANILQVVVVVASFSLLVVALDENENSSGERSSE